MLRAEHASLINALVSFTFSSQMVEDLTRSTAPLYRCNCDTKNQIVPLMHDAETERYHNDRLFRDFCSCVFHAMIKVAFIDLDPYQLAKVRSRSTGLKAKDQANVALAHYLLKNPSLVMRSSLAWYQKTRSLCVLEFISGNFAPSSSPMHKTLLRVFFSAASIKPFFELVVMVLMRLVGYVCSVVRSRKYACQMLEKESECTPAIMLVGRLIHFTFGGPDPIPYSAPSHLLKQTYDMLSGVLANCDENTLSPFPVSKELVYHLTSYLARETAVLHSTLKERTFPNLPPVDLIAAYGDEGIYMVLLHLIHEARQQRRCQSLVCENNPSASTKSYSRCGGYHVFA